MESPTIDAPSGRNVQRRLETGDVAGSKKHDRPLGVADQGVGVGLGNLLAALGLDLVDESAEGVGRVAILTRVHAIQYLPSVGQYATKNGQSCRWRTLFQ